MSFFVVVVGSQLINESLFLLMFTMLSNLLNKPVFFVVVEFSIEIMTNVCVWQS